VGIVLDSSVIVAAERRGHTVREILEQVKAVQGDENKEWPTLACLRRAAINQTRTDRPPKSS